MKTLSPAFNTFANSMLNQPSRLVAVHEIKILGLEPHTLLPLDAPHRNTPTVGVVIVQFAEVHAGVSRRFEQLHRFLAGTGTHVQASIQSIVTEIAATVPDLKVVQGDDRETPALARVLVPAHGFAVLQFPPA